MPTSGGGGHGGFGGGGFHGGGGGGFHGGGMRGPRMGGLWFFGPRFYYGGGCLGWLLGPIIALAMIVMIMIFILISLIGSIGQKNVAYSEDTFNDYLLDRYEEVFSSESGYEDKVLLGVLVYEDGINYDYMAMTGDHLPRNVYNQFGSDRGTTLTRAMTANMDRSSGYTGKLNRCLEGVVDDLKTGLGTVTFTCSETHVGGSSHLIDNTALSIDPVLVNTALADFTAATGLEMVIVVDEAADVFGYQTPVAGIVALVILTLIAGVIIYAIIRGNRERKKRNDNQNNGDGNYRGGGSFNGNPRTDNNPYGTDNW